MLMTSSAAPHASSDQTPPSFPGFTVFPNQPPMFNAERGVWLAFSYADAHRVLNEHTIFSNERGGLDPAVAMSEDMPQIPVMIGMDPPQHRKYRNLVSQAFTPRMVAQLEPRIHAIADELLDRAIERGAMDVINDFAYLLSVTVIAELLGVPSEHQAQFRVWSDAFFEITSPAAMQAQMEMGGYFLGVLNERRQNPQNDLVTALAQAEVDGQRLSDFDIITHCSLILLAGNDTTRNLIGNAVLCFDSFPQMRAHLQANMELMPSAIEEVLRYLPSVHTAPRMTKVDTVLNGVAIAAGQWVMPMLASANRDETQFANPHQFDITRTPNRHLTFGHGIHFCLGAPLARLEAKIGLQKLLTRLHNIKVLRDEPLEAVTSPIVYGVKILPISFDAA